MTEPGEDHSRMLLPAWRELDDGLRSFVAARVPAADVDDLMQDCFVKVSQGLPALQDHERLGAWIFRIARNLIVDHRRRRQRGPRTELLEDGRTDAENPDGQAEVAGWLAAFVDRLPERYAEALRLAELEGLSQGEIATRLGLSVSGVKSRIQRGRALLRERLQACCSFEFDRRGRIVDHQRRSPGRCDCS